MMMVAPNSCARKGGKGEYGRIMMVIAPNSGARKGEEVKGKYEGV